MLFLKQGDNWNEVGRTEMVKDSLNPEFVRSFKVPFHFEEVQYLRLVVYDVDDVDKGLEKQDLIGETTVSLSEVVTAKGQVGAFSFVGEKGILIVFFGRSWCASCLFRRVLARSAA